MRFHYLHSPDSLRESSRVLAEISRCVEVRVKSKTANRWLLEVLAHTSDGEVRNKAALALGDLRVQEAVPVIVRLLSADATAGNRGSLLFALLSLDYRDYLGAIASQLGSGVYEVMEMALQLLEQLPSRVRARQTRNAIKQLEQLAIDSTTQEYVKQGILLLQAATHPAS